MLISIAAAYLYGLFFVNAVAPDMSETFYRHPFVWGVAAIAAALVALLTSLLRRKIDRGRFKWRETSCC